EGGDITSWDMLVDAAVRAGLDGPEVRTWLEEGKGGDEVDREVEQAFRENLRGVPRFTIQGKYHVDGADDISAFMEQFTAAKEDALAAENALGDDKFCTPDGLSC